MKSEFIFQNLNPFGEGCSNVANLDIPFLDLQRPPMVEPHKLVKPLGGLYSGSKHKTNLEQ